MFGSGRGKQAKDFARRVAKEIYARVPPALASKDVDRALRHVTLNAQEYRRTHKIGVFGLIGLSRAFQSELGDMGYDSEFIKTLTVALARAMRE